MFLSLSNEGRVQEEYQIYDAILMQICTPHPNMTIFEEADLKGRLLKVIGTCLNPPDPRRLLHLFREAMETSDI